ncbi:MAG TPA: nuclear transport factor 2 family protein [Methylotenera sp.]|jgi:galactose-1-phosphate uridylyltransferase|nr:nuclear transport factor 2 family protein [Methylotenera sp.]
MISREFAQKFSDHWIESWNSHDLDQILSHYDDDFEMSSPYIMQIAGEPTGVLKGKNNVGAYWRSALEKIPTLKFELVDFLTGVDSITIYYRGVHGMAAEVFIFNSADKVIKAYAHYA